MGKISTNIESLFHTILFYTNCSVVIYYKFQRVLIRVALSKLRCPGNAAKRYRYTRVINGKRYYYSDFHAICILRVTIINNAA